MQKMKTNYVAGEAAKGAIDVLKDYPDLERFSAVDIRNAWGLDGSFDIYDCNPETIRDADEMKRFGECVVVNFGENERVAGFSMTQLIETSLISAHFANATNTTYLDVFSCKPYNPKIVKEFAMEFFGGSRCTMQVNLRA